jgi:hypothetical protein
MPIPPMLDLAIIVAGSVVLAGLLTTIIAVEVSVYFARRRR